jgi:hypothetical protein
MTDKYKGRIEKERGEHGWFKKGEHSYTPLLRNKAVQLLAKSFPPRNIAGELYQFKWFLNYNNLGPEEFLGLPDKEVKQAIIEACIAKTSEGKQSKRMFYVVTRFLMLNGRSIEFSRQERRLFLKRTSKGKLAKQYVPTKDDVYRMADSFPNKGVLQQKRGKALILDLWQSGVRANCLCSWTWGMFKNKLYPTIEVPLPIKVVAEKPEDAFDCAEDSKLSSYDVNYYFTFLHEEGAHALKDYLDERIRNGWQPQDGDPVFVTESVVRRGTPVNAVHLTSIVKTAGKQIGISSSGLWTHCLRKSFRKTLYASGVDPDVAEALMGHKLGASRGSYFDYHDLNFAETEYMQGHWQRVGIDTVKQLEEEIGKLRQNGIAKEEEKTKELEELKTKVDLLEKALKGLTR